MVLGIDPSELPNALLQHLLHLGDGHLANEQRGQAHLLRLGHAESNISFSESNPETTLMSCTSYTISNRFGFHFNSTSSIAFVVLHRDQHPTIPKHPIIPPNSTIQTIPSLSPSTPWYLRIPGDKVCSGIGIVRGFDGLDLTLWLLKHVLQAEENMSFLRGLVKACTKRIQHYI